MDNTARMKLTSQRCDVCWAPFFPGEGMMITEASTHDSEELKRRYMAREPLVNVLILMHEACDPSERLH